MIHQITDVNGKTVEVECLGCALANGTIDGVGSSIMRTDFFDVSQDFEIPIPGFMIISSLRHVRSVDDFTEDEAIDFIDVLRKTRKLQRTVLDIETVYIHQEEDTSSHFHVWMLPRYDWMKEKFGRKVESMRPIMEFARQEMKTEENTAELYEYLRQLRAAA